MDSSIGKERKNVEGSSKEEKEKKKNISLVEIAQVLSHKNKSDLQNADSKHRESDSTVNASSKAFSFKCGLADSTVASMLQSPSSYPGTLVPSASDNVGVRSMSFNFQGGEMLGELEASTIAALLRETADALVILRRSVRVAPPQLDHHPPRIEVRRKGTCNAENEKKLYFGDDAGFAPVVPSVAVKLLKERDLAYNVFRKVACELENNNGSYDWLRCEVNAIVESKEKERSLEVNLKIWSDLSKRLQEAQKMSEEEFQNKKKEYLDKINDLAQKIDSSYCVNNEKLDYIRKWEACKLEQQNLRQSLEEESMLYEIKEIEKARKAHAKVSEELQAYGASAINHRKDEIRAWSTQYNTELERRQQETTELQEKIEEIQEYLEKSRELQAERQVIIDAYNEEQNKINEEIEYWNAIHRAATLIQAIWRGYMVRHELGPYFGLKKKNKRRKKSKKPKKENKKENKKKKGKK